MTAPLTIERLRNQLFSRSAYPHWQYRLDRLLFGVEVEYHVARKGNRKRLFKKADFEAFLQRMRRYGYAPHQAADQPWRVSKDTEFGYIVIKPDFAFHLLEIALPPRSDLVSFSELLDEVLREIDSCLAEPGFERLDESFLPVEQSDMELVETARLEEYLDCLWQNSCQNEFSDRYFPAFFAATHVHLNVLTEKDLRLSPLLYELEWLAMSLFDRSHHPELPIRSLRTMYYRDAFGYDYRLVGVPERIPASLEDYVEQFNASPKLFPNDPFFPVRDCSLIRPTRYGTMEFRSACSPPDIETAKTMIAFRIVQWLYAIKYADKPLDPVGAEQHRAIMWYADGRVNKESKNGYENDVLERMEKVLSEAGEYGKIIQQILPQEVEPCLPNR